MDLVPPYGVYLDGKELAVYATEHEAEARFQALRRGELRPAQETQEKA